MNDYLDREDILDIVSQYCTDDGGCDVAYRWRYADEAIKLIGENTDETNT